MEPRRQVVSDLRLDPAHPLAIPGQGRSDVLAGPMLAMVTPPGFARAALISRLLYGRATPLQCKARMSAEPQQRLNFFPLPQGQGSFLPTLTFLTGSRGVIE